ncbi:MULTISPECIES: DUF6603 domain-containing protein [unclassified Streptomyces]|uniref:DUF6603 domain-containing protein n=1 Tax=unclassified Streptomyces TaxID=2593676 RepID=UPI00371E1990
MSERQQACAPAVQGTVPDTSPAGIRGAATGVKVLLVEVEVSGGLSNLPVIGAHVPADAVRLQGLYTSVSSRPLDEKDAEAVNGALAKADPSGLRVPADGLAGKCQIGVAVRVGGKDVVLSTAGDPTGGSAGEGDADAGAVVWYAMGQSLGPVQLERLGVQYAGKKVWLLLDAGISTDALTLSAQGIGLGVGLTRPPTVEGRLDGLGLAWDRPPIKVSGALLNRRTPGYVVDVQGAAAVVTPALSLGAVGGYAQPENGGPSLFVYGQLAFKEGESIGPPPFRVTGAAAGFGYNSTVRVPDVSGVEDFPFMPGNAGSVTEDPLAYLGKLTDGPTPWVTRTQGRMWLAAGLQFDSFSFLHGRALALVEFALAGKSEFTIALLGQVGAQFPTAPATAYANVALDVVASYSSSEDVLEVSAALDPASFLLHRSCRLTGSAALRLWFGNSAHPGDFVFAAGGYGPAYSKPEHYPEAQPIGVSWSVSDDVWLRGSCYAALVPRAFMVGARLDVGFQLGPISAGLRASLDAMVQWDPFYFRVSVHVDVWVEVDLWVTTLRGSFGVGLDLWGPPTGGIASVEALGRSFDIAFGERPPTRPSILSWDTFVQRLLPRPVANVVAESGLLPGVPGQAADARPQPAAAPERERWTLSPHGFTLLTRTALPPNRLRVADSPTTEKSLPRVGDRNPIRIRPVGADQVNSTHLVTVTLDGVVYDVLSEAAGWVLTPVEGKVPEALWGKPLPVGAAPAADGGEEALIDAWTGLRIATPGRRLSFDCVTATDSAVKTEEIAGPALPPLVHSAQAPPVRKPGARRAITDPATGITGPDTARAREALRLFLESSGVPVRSEGRPLEPDALTHYAKDLRDYLRSEPLTHPEQP